MSWFSTEGASALGAGLLCPAGSVTDKELANRVIGYKRSVAGRYRAYTGDELDQLPPTPMHVSPKVDGELWLAIIEDGHVALVSPRLRVITGDVPVVQELRERVAPKCVGRTILAGELFAIRKGGRPRVGDVGVALAGGADAGVARLGYFVFDLVAGGDAQDPDAAAEYAAKFAVLERLIGKGKRCQLVPTEVLAGPEALRAKFDALVEPGKAEGLVARAEDHRIFKIKPAVHLDAAVIGFTERAPDPGMPEGDLCRSVLLALIREPGQFQIIGSCGNFGGDDMRRRMHALLAPLAAPSTYRYPSSTGALYRFVRPEVVVEVRVSDVQAEDSYARPIQRFVLEHDADRGWTPLRPMNGVSILHPVFQRLRGDKQVNAVDVRIDQVLERVVLDDAHEVAERVDLPVSEVLRRQVWTKVTKGKTAVRKLLVWRTHKDDQDALYPAFVVHWTDYSPGRKDPLKREVKLAPTQAAADALAEAFVEKGVKRGWQEAP